MKRMYSITFGLGIALLLIAAPVMGQPQEVPLGTEMPTLDQPLTRTDGTQQSLSDITGETATVILFWSNQCPWVQKYQGRVMALVSEFSGESVQFALVNSNDPSAFPQESLEASREHASEENYQAPYFRDPGSALAEALGASRTPQVFVFDSTQTLVYTGTIDDSPATEERVTTPYLQNALTALVNGEEIAVPQTKAFGCTIKYQQ